MSGARVPSNPIDFTWVAEQNLHLYGRDWRTVAAMAGAIVADDILSRVSMSIFDDKDGEWQVHVFVDAYTDGAGDEIQPVALASLIEAVSGYGESDAALGLVALLREQANRLEAAALEEKARHAALALPIPGGENTEGEKR